MLDGLLRLILLDDLEVLKLLYGLLELSSLDNFCVKKEIFKIYIIDPLESPNVHRRVIQSHGTRKC